jgi:hypothetical protein
MIKKRRPTGCEQTIQFIAACALALVAGVVPSLINAGTHAELVSDYERERQLADAFLSEYGTYMFGPTNASVSELRVMLTKPLPKDLPLDEAMKNTSAYGYFGGENPVSDMAPFRWSDYVNLDVAMRSTNLSWSAEYMRRSTAADRLADTDPGFNLDYMVIRANRNTPTLFDVVLSVGPKTWREDFARATAKTADGRRKWKQLAQCKNPVYRMLALRWSKTWAEPAEQLDLWKRALGDEYWYTRLLAVRFLGELDSPVAREALTKFLKRPIDPTLPPQFHAKEKELTERAMLTLGLIKQLPAPSYDTEE